MPCYQVRLTNVEFKTTSKKRLLETLADLNVNTNYDERRNKIYTTFAVFDLNNNNVRIQKSDYYFKMLNEVKREYAFKTVQEKLKKYKWSTRNSTQNKFQFKAIKY